MFIMTVTNRLNIISLEWERYRSGFPSPINTINSNIRLNSYYKPKIKYGVRTS